VNESAVDSQAPKAPAGAQSQRATVLFVDDEPALLDGLRNALRREPFQILTASSAKMGLELLSQRPVDVVVSDERMPGISGSEFLGIVRQRHPQTLRIILTGQASLEAAIRAINEGEVYRFLTKPCSPVQLAHTIRDALLIRDLTREASRLLTTAKRQRGVLEELEATHPGITHVERTADGCIVLETEDVDVGELLAQMEAETRRNAR